MARKQSYAAKLIKERDNARREICKFRSNVSTPAQYCKRRGWGYLYKK